MVRGLIEALLKLAAFGALVGLIAGAIPSLHPAADSFAHFRLHFAIVLAIYLPLLAICLRGWPRWAALGITVLIGLVVRAALLAGPPAAHSGAEMRLVQFNLNFRNPALADVVAYLRETDGDVVTLQEVTAAHRAQIETRLSDLYPHQHYCPFAAVGGVAILSKYPLAPDSGGCADWRGLAWGRVETPKGPLTVASLHTYWPWPMGQHSQIDRWEPLLSGMQAPVVIAGDFNAAPWSHSVDRVAKATRASVVPGLRISIGVRLFDWLPAVPIPIDHVLVSNELCGLAAHVGPVVGSDHYPIVVDLGWHDPNLSTGCSRYR